MTNRSEGMVPPGGFQNESSHFGVDKSDLKKYERGKDYVLSREKEMDQVLKQIDEVSARWREAVEEFKAVSKKIDKYLAEWTSLVERIKVVFPKAPETKRGQDLFNESVAAADKYKELVSSLVSHHEELGQQLKEFEATSTRLNRDFYATIAEMSGGIPGLN